MVCFLALECGYWQVSQFENWVSLVCMMPPDGIFIRTSAGDWNSDYSPF
jgi:hypothetical protein